MFEAISHIVVHFPHLVLRVCLHQRVGRAEPTTGTKGEPEGERKKRGRETTSRKRRTIERECS